jgi:hypothetical protein
VYGTATATVLVFVLGNRIDVKQTLVDSGAYDKFVPSIIESNKDNKSIPLEDPEVKKIINQSFPPEKLRTETELIVDSIFDWLEGSKNSVSFSVDFTENKTMLGDQLSRYAFNGLAFKEECRSQPETFDPFTTTCRPYGYDIFEGEKRFAEQIKSSEGFLGKTVLTEQSLPKNKAGKSIFEEYYYAPIAYEWLIRAPWILGALTILTAIGYVVYLPNKRRGMVSLGKRIFFSSATLIATPILFSFVLPYFTNSYGNELGGSSSEVLLNDILSTLTRNFDRMMIIFGVWLMLIGLAIIVGERMTRPRTRYVGVEKRAGLTSSNERPKKQSSPRGTLNESTLPLQSSEVSVTKKAKKPRKNSKYRKIPI